MRAEPTGYLIIGRFAKQLWLLVLLLLSFSVCADETFERVSVVDPYLELRTGPGRGYPITTIAERGESVEILGRRTDWFKVRTARGKEGWVVREQMERTLTEAGVKTTFRDVLVEDYLRRRVEFGFAYGQFESDPILTAHIGYRLHDNFLAELALSQVPGDFSSTSLFYASIVSQPYPDSDWSPFFSLGYGKFNNKPKATLVSAIETNADLANAGLGVRYYLTRRFVARFEFKQHVTLIDFNRTDSFKEWSLGISAFF
ncbi:MAG TPA: SH3 domain-containing protein [Burkholderiales bacterium]